MGKKRIVFCIAAAALALVVLGGLSFLLFRVLSDDPSGEVVKLTEKDGTQLSSIDVRDLAPGEGFEKIFILTSDGAKQAYEMTFHLKKPDLAPFLDVRIEETGKVIFSDRLDRLETFTYDGVLDSRIELKFVFSLSDKLGNEVQNLTCEFDIRWSVDGDAQT